MASDDSVRMMVEYAGGIFDSLYVMDPEVRAKVARKLLESEQFFELTNHKFDIELLASKTGEVPGARDVRPVVTLPVGLMPYQRNMLETQYPNFNLRFIDTSKLPHGMAFAQRIVDTRELLISIGDGDFTIIDVGGNYLMHARRQSRAEVHSCTLKSGWREYHRQKQRDVTLEMEGLTANFCVDGVEHCEVKAKKGISVHTLPEIDPDLWPGIFQSHNLEVVEAVFHYEPEMDTEAESGYLKKPAMFWKTVGEDVEFFFEHDSSFDYRHKKQRLREYARPWVRTLDGWDYVVHNHIKMIDSGVVRCTLTRLDASTLGYVSTAPLYRWVGGYGSVVVPVPIYDEKAGLSIHDPRAYTIHNMDVPLDMYNFAFMKGIANDTSRPDLPLTRQELANAMHVYNANRTLNGVPISEKVKFDAVTIERMTTGVYLAVVTQAARNRVTLGQYTDQMLRMQRRWGHESMLWLLAAGVRSVAILPFVLLAEEIETVVDVITVLFRNAGDDRFLSPPARKKPYVEIGVMKCDVSVEFNAFVSAHEVTDSDSDIHSVGDTRALREEYYHTFRDELPRGVKEQMERELFSGVPPPRRTEIPKRDFFEDEIESDLPSRQEVYEKLYTNRDAWLVDFETMRDETRELHMPTEPVESDLATVHKYDELMVKEYALHCFDLHLCAQAKCLEFLDRHWRVDKFNTKCMADDNFAFEIDAAVYSVLDGYLQNLPDDVHFDVVLDPVTRRFIDVRRRPGGSFVGRVSCGMVYTTNHMRIFNSKRLGLVAMAALEKGLNVSHVPMHLVDGIAGSGKTRTLTDSMAADDIYVTVPRAAAEAVQGWAAQQPRFAEEGTDIKARIRTLDSYLLNSKMLGNTLLVDEGFMTHPGAPLVILDRTRAKALRMSGDSAQIGLIDRGAGYGRLRFTKAMHWTSVTQFNVSDRMPQDATYLCRQFYPPSRRHLIKTKSPVRRSFAYEYIPDPNSNLFYQHKPYSHIVPILQGCKQAMVSKPGFVDGKIARAEGRRDPESDTRPVLTAHEAQGDTYPVTIAVRLNKHSSTIFASEPHQYVCISRHTLLYILRSVATPAQCPLSRLVCSAIELTDAQLDEVVEDTPSWLAEARIHEHARVSKYYALLWHP